MPSNTLVHRLGQGVKVDIDLISTQPSPACVGSPFVFGHTSVRCDVQVVPRGTPTVSEIEELQIAQQRGLQEAVLSQPQAGNTGTKQGSAQQEAQARPRELVGSGSRSTVKPCTDVTGLQPLTPLGNGDKRFL
jgi:hypothetical protein